MGEWEDYGECSRACGLGAMTRERKVIQQPRNGGKKCPVLKESTVCKGTRCKSQRHIGRRGRTDQGITYIYIRNLPIQPLANCCNISLHYYFSFFHLYLPQSQNI